MNNKNNDDTRPFVIRTNNNLIEDFKNAVRAKGLTSTMIFIRLMELFIKKPNEVMSFLFAEIGEKE